MCTLACMAGACMGGWAGGRAGCVHGRATWIKGGAGPGLIVCRGGGEGGGACQAGNTVHTCLTGSCHASGGTRPSHYALLAWIGPCFMAHTVYRPQNSTYRTYSSKLHEGIQARHASYAPASGPATILEMAQVRAALRLLHIRWRGLHIRNRFARLLCAQQGGVPPRARGGSMTDRIHAAVWADAQRITKHGLLAGDPPRQAAGRPAPCHPPGQTCKAHTPPLPLWLQTCTGGRG